MSPRLKSLLVRALLVICWIMALYGLGRLLFRLWCLSWGNCL